MNVLDLQHWKWHVMCMHAILEAVRSRPSLTSVVTGIICNADSRPRFGILDARCTLTSAVHIALSVVRRCSSNREVETAHRMPDAAPATANGQAEEPRQVRIGVLALQGSFREHIASLRRLPDVEAIEVRTKEQLHSVDGLIIPGTSWMHRPELHFHADMLCDAM